MKNKINLSWYDRGYTSSNLPHAIDSVHINSIVDETLLITWTNTTNLIKKDKNASKKIIESPSHVKCFS